LESRPEGIAHIRCRVFACGPPLPLAPDPVSPINGRKRCEHSLVPLPQRVRDADPAAENPNTSSVPGGANPWGLARTSTASSKRRKPVSYARCHFGIFLCLGQALVHKSFRGIVERKSRPFGRMFPCRGLKGKFRFGAKGSGNSLPAPLRRSPHLQDFLEISDVHFILMENRHLGPAAAQDIHGDLFSFFIEEG